MIHNILNSNQIIFQYLNSLALRYNFLDQIIIFSTNNLGILLTVFLIVFLLLHKHPKEGIKNILVVATSAILAWLISMLIKHLYINPRPFISLPPEKINLLFEYGGYDSFPSGHATFYSALASAIFAYHKRLGIIYALGALLVGVSRVVAGIHWPIDILAGYAIGGIIGYIAYRLITKVGSQTPNFLFGGRTSK